MMWLYGTSLCHGALLFGRMVQWSVQEMVNGIQDPCLFLLEHHWQALPLQASGTKSSWKCSTMSWNKWAPGQIFWFHLLISFFLELVRFDSAWILSHALLGSCLITLLWIPAYWCCLGLFYLCYKDSSWAGCTQLFEGPQNYSQKSQKGFENHGHWNDSNLSEVK